MLLDPTRPKWHRSDPWEVGKSAEEGGKEWGLEIQDPGELIYVDILNASKHHAKQDVMHLVCHSLVVLIGS